MRNSQNALFSFVPTSMTRRGSVGFILSSAHEMLWFTSKTTCHAQERPPRGLEHNSLMAYRITSRTINGNVSNVTSTCQMTDNSTVCRMTRGDVTSYSVCTSRRTYNKLSFAYATFTSVAL